MRTLQRVSYRPNALRNSFCTGGINGLKNVRVAARKFPRRQSKGLTPVTAFLRQDGPTTQAYEWIHDSGTFRVPFDVRGNGEPLLLLPAMSTVSCRSELTSLSEILGDTFLTVTPDWPGFGESTRLEVDYNPDIFRRFLRDFVRDNFDGKAVDVVACGHASAYALELGSESSGTRSETTSGTGSGTGPFSHIAVVAPTWKGPFTIMGINKGVSSALRKVVESPLVGEFLYNTITTPESLRSQYQSHVFTSPGDVLSDDFIREKQMVTNREGARFAPAAFVTGSLDLAQDRSEVLEWFEKIKGDMGIPVMVVIGDGSPKRSKAEMEAMGQVSGVEVGRCPGSLGMHEEFPKEVAEKLLPFLKGG